MKEFLRIKSKHKSVLAVVIVTIAMCSIATAQQQSINDGVYTETQASAGQVIYEENCKSCHDMRFYENSLISWRDMTLLDYWYSMLGNMPADNPGSLLDSEYLDVIAYILSENDFPAGETALEPSNRLGKIKIVSLPKTDN